MVALEPVAYQSASQARVAAHSLAQTHVGVIAWSRSADPDIGEYGEPEVLVRLGMIPEWFDEGGGVE